MQYIVHLCPSLLSLFELLFVYYPSRLTQNSKIKILEYKGGKFSSLLLPLLSD